MIFIVILEPLVKLRHDGFCIGTIMDIDVIPLEGLDEGFGDTVGFRASDGGKTADESHILSKGNRLSGRVATPIVAKPFHRMGSLAVPKRRSTDSIIRSRTISPVMPPVVATWLIISRSQQSRAKATRNTWPFQQEISKPSEHQRKLERKVTTFPS